MSVKTIFNDRTKQLIYFLLRLSVVLVGIRQFFLGNYHGVFMCFLTLILLLIPKVINQRFQILLPNLLEIIIIVFIYSAEILGEVNRYYLTVPHFDTVLHTINGFIMAGVGFALVDILNRSEQVSFSLSPLFLVVVAFCFSMTTGVLWEFFEFGMDQVFLTDMQKDTVIQQISSVNFHPEGLNESVTIPIESVVVNGETWELGGYLDIGLIDTMKDLIVNFIGAVVFSAFGWLYLKGKSRLAGEFIPRVASSDSTH